MTDRLKDDTANAKTRPLFYEAKEAIDQVSRQRKSDNFL